MAARVSDSLPAVFKPFLGFVRAKAGERVQEATARESLLVLCQKGYAAKKGFSPKALALYLNMVRSCVAAEASVGLPGPLQFGWRDTEHFDAEDLKRIARLARELRDEVRKLKRTNLVFELQIGGQIPPGDLLSAPLADDEGVALKTLMGLPALARSHKKTHLPGIDYSLWRLCRYVDETTGNPNDGLLVNIVGPLGIPHTQSPDALKVWRLRRR